MKKAANGSGSVERRGLLWWARVTAPGKPRRRLPMAGSELWSRGQAKREAKKLSADYAAGRIVFDADTSKTVSLGGVLTVRQAGDAWTNGELLKKYGAVNRLRLKAGAQIDAWTLKAHVYKVKTRGENGPDFGDLTVRQVTEIDVERVMAAQPLEQRAETKIKQYNRLHRLFDLTIYPLRLRIENPVDIYFRPSPDAEKLFNFLYPTEVITLLRGTNKEGEIVVPLARRVLFAIGLFTGQRKGSLLAQTWGHVDFDHGTLASFKTKTGRAQYFVADPGLLDVLEGWYLHQGEPEDDEPIIPPPPTTTNEKGKTIADWKKSAIGVEPKYLADALREDLKAVGVTRSILFEDDAENVEALRFHDLRSTFCTWARRAGKSDSWISERTGHDIVGKMIARYDRGAQTLSDLEYEPFPDISRAIPELYSLRLATRLATTASEEIAAIESAAIFSRHSVGAIGIEPTTPTVSR